MNNETEHIFLLNPASSQSSELIQKMGALVPPPISQVNLENVKDFSHVCRTCATITELVMPIYAGEGLHNNLADKIKKHLPIQVSESDELPLVVCYQCVSTLLAFHELVKCCEQANAALHAKLRSNQRKLNGTINMHEEDAESKNSLVEYCACVYCPTSHPANSYKQHLVLMHGDLLFHCEICDLFVDRKDFIMHMSYHTIQYDNEERLKKMKKKKEVASAQPRPAPPAPAPAPQATPKTESKSVKTETKKPTVAAKSKTNAQVNEFSDHSDMDDFGPLPESVFEAIEDTQDSQLEDNTNQTLESDRLGGESNRSSPPENNDSSNPGQCLENNNNFKNNCSVLIEHIDSNSCTQSMNMVITNASSNASNSHVLPATKTTPKSSTSYASEMKNKNRKKTRKCPLCPKEYHASSSYFYHQKHTHRSSKEHECEVCGKKFGTRSCLKQHMAVHTAQYEFECKQCQKQFKSKAGLYIHEQTHGGHKAWACSQCHAAFRWKAQLLRHAQRHAPDRGHVCDTCGRAFSVRGDLLRHARTHAAGSFVCDHCGQKFAQPRYLRVHTLK